jgi:hypothetical protein
MTAKLIIAWKVTPAGFFDGKCDQAQIIVRDAGLDLFPRKGGEWLGAPIQI